jgi:hypothetical protein
MRPLDGLLLGLFLLALSGLVALVGSAILPVNYVTVSECTGLGVSAATYTCRNHTEVQGLHVSRILVLGEIICAFVGIVLIPISLYRLIEPRK